ncbi:MAG: aminotransferase class III-fold pyridoxal phosphate-dependent enzyme, partial [Limnochordia bacterium]
MSRNYPIIERGSGVFLYDEQGNEYLDAAGGIGVVNIGHGVKEIAEVAKKQMETLAFAFSGAVASRPTMELAEKLAAMAPPGMGEVKVFFSSGGSEANEAALKLARTYYLAKGIHSKYRFVSRWQGYHGNTMGTLSITGRTRWREPYLPLLLNFPHIYPPICYHCPFDSEYPRCDVKCA